MAPRLKWKESFSVGHDVLDLQHRGLVKLINQVRAAPDARKDTTGLHPVPKTPS